MGRSIETSKNKEMKLRALLGNYLELTFGGKNCLKLPRVFLGHIAKPHRKCWLGALYEVKCVYVWLEVGKRASALETQEQETDIAPKEIISYFLHSLPLIIKYTFSKLYIGCLQCLRQKA